MRSLLLFLVIGMTGLSFFNLFTLYRPRISTEVGDRIAVLIPLRNEADNVSGLIETLQAQAGVSRAHFYLLNDNSEDETLALLQRQINGDQRFTVIDGAALPSGWLGKPWALSQLENASSEEIIITMDADVRLQPYALSSATMMLHTSGLHFISPYPKQIAGTFAEKLIQPLVHWTWIATLPLRFAARSHRPSMAVANGQFLLVRRSALARVGGFASISSEVLDDVMLARTLMRAGFNGTAAEGASIAQTRMYSSFAQIRAGYGKSLWKAFGGPLGPYVAIAFIFFTSIYPFFLIREFYGWVVIFYLLMTRMVSAIIAREKIRYIFLHPFSAALFIYLIIYSLLRHSSITWKERPL